MLFRLSLAATFLVALVGTAPADAAGCSVAVGQQILLAASEADPDVFVWDTKGRMVDYAMHSWSKARDVMEHTAIAKPGTRAVVVQCDAEIVKSKLVPESEDAVGIRLLTGSARGTYGWVTSEDVRAMHVGTSSPPPRITRRPNVP